MKINIVNLNEDFKKSLTILQDYLPFEIADDGITLTAASGSHLAVVCNGKSAEIIYSCKVEFFRAVMLLATSGNKNDFNIKESRRFDWSGVMIDNSRNAVLKCDTVRDVINYMALMGLEKLMLYTEDTYEVEGYPYFGYLRGRFSKNALKDLVAYGKLMGVTLVPCIQTLGHFDAIVRWQAFKPIVDCNNILLAGDDDTYKFIDAMIKSCRESFETDEINIGMDEAWMLGFGKYREKNGIREQADIFCEHLNKVVQICKKYNFKPMIWSDMFFSMVFDYYYAMGGDIPADVIAKVPSDVKLIYWDYDPNDTARYDDMMRKHNQFDNEIIFAGTAWKWSGFAPEIAFSLDANENAINRCYAAGVRKFFPTAWGDNGAETSLYTILPAMLQYAEMNYQAEYCKETFEQRFTALIGISIEDFVALDLPNLTPTSNGGPWNNPSKYLLYNDILAGIFDKHVRDDFANHYKTSAAKLNEIAQKGGKFAYIFENLANLCKILELKCDIGVRLKTAYDNDDKSSLAKFIPELSEILARVEVFHKSFRAQWFSEYRPNGFDVQDLRLGGLKERIKAAIWRIEEYVNGNITAIPELAEERLWFDNRAEAGSVVNTNCNLWHLIATPNTTAGV